MVRNDQIEIQLVDSKTFTDPSDQSRRPLYFGAGSDSNFGQTVTQEATRGIVVGTDNFNRCRKCENLSFADCVTQTTLEVCDNGDGRGDQSNVCQVTITTKYIGQNSIEEKVSTGCARLDSCKNQMKQNFLHPFKALQRCRPRNFQQFYSEILIL